MYSFSHTEDATEPSFQVKAVVRSQGKFTEAAAIRILASRGVKFSAQKGKARRESPMQHWASDQETPAHLKYVVLEKDTLLGNRAWAKVDFLVHYCGYTLIDERL
jgi:hypothetical protein